MLDTLSMQQNVTNKMRKCSLGARTTGISKITGELSPAMKIQRQQLPMNLFGAVASDIFKIDPAETTPEEILETIVEEFDCIDLKIV